jgi:hypothetical protein
MSSLGDVQVQGMRETPPARTVFMICSPEWVLPVCPVIPGANFHF